MAAEEVRTALRRRLMEEYGMDEADLLLDRPPGGWDDLVTKDWLHLEFAAIEPRFASIESRLSAVEERLTSIDGRLSSMEGEIRAQTWRLIGAMTALLGALVAAIKL